MVAVSVRTESSTLCGIRTEWPVAISTAIVSPTARPTPSSDRGQQAVSRRGTAARARSICQRVAPERRGGLAVAVGDGLERVLADRHDDRHAHQREDDPAVEHVEADRGAGDPHDQRVHDHQPMKPQTTDGMAASSSMTIFSPSFQRGLQNSDRKTAAPIPKGTAMAIESAVTAPVPAMSARAPYRLRCTEVGYHSVLGQELHPVEAAEQEPGALAEDEEEDAEDEDDRGDAARAG